jgi:PAS domain S-box-containing protein
MNKAESPGGNRVLIVEDELIVAADIEGSLGELGFQVVGTAGNAQKALALVAEQRPHVVLMDIQLHGDPAGISLAETIRRQWNVPVVFLTAYVTPDFMQRARTAGAYGFLSKPFRIEDLNAAILIALQQHRLTQGLFAEHHWLVMMMASLRDGVIATDAAGCVRYLNPAAEELIHWSSAEALGKSIEEVYPLTHLDGSEVEACQVRRALAEQRPIPKKRFLMKVHPDHRLPVEDAAAPIFQDGHLLGAVTIFYDISAQLREEAKQQTEQKRLETEVKETNAALGQTREELRALSGRLINAQEDERRRVARELHDDFGQRAAVMSWRIASLSKMAPALPAEGQNEISLLQEELNRLSVGLRDVSHHLHPSAIADLGLASALAEIVEQHRGQGLDVTFIERDMPAKLDTDVATGLYRIAQEAVRNAVQHAPGAPVLVTLSFASGSLQLRVEDPGPGFDLADVSRTGGLGLLSIQERARLMGGTLEIQTAKDEGTVVTVRIPIQ